MGTVELMELAHRHARAGRVPRLSDAEIASLRPQVAAWSLITEAATGRLRRELTFADFKAAMVFVNRVAELAEAENHHPDLAIHYNRVELTLWTHDAGGLTENDFILAAKIDELAAG
jgi:4a-hydroxytetrahydrobiopterin dehydratase